MEREVVVGEGERARAGGEQESDRGIEGGTEREGKRAREGGQGRRERENDRERYRERDRVCQIRGLFVFDSTDGSSIEGRNH